VYDQAAELRGLLLQAKRKRVQGGDAAPAAAGTESEQSDDGGIEQAALD
jgi:hypothetical protein